MKRAAAILERFPDRALLLAGVAAPAAAEPGEALFNDACAACHQAGGAGNPGVAPPLNDPILWWRLGDRAAIGTYVLSALNTTGLRLDAETVAAIRRAPPSHVALRKLRKD